jgi:chromosome segregation ATPase
MDQDKSEVGAPVGEEEAAREQSVNEQKSPDQIRQEIEETRQELGDTAAALAAKTDVKSRAKEKVEDIKQTVTEKKDAKVEGIKQTVADKKESFASSSSSSATGTTAGGSQGSSPLDQVKAKAPELKAKAQENPVPTAAVAAFIGGFVFGRLTSR